MYLPRLQVFKGRLLVFWTNENPLLALEIHPHELATMTLDQILHSRSLCCIGWIPRNIAHVKGQRGSIQLAKYNYALVHGINFLQNANCIHH